MPITNKHQSYADMSPRWRLNRAGCAGQDAVKRETTLFLPDDSEGDKSIAARNRYLRYMMRATWLKVAGYTKEGLIGMVFRLPPSVELPSALDYMLENADGAGSSLAEFSRLAVGENIEVGRLGILTDYPASEVGLSRQQIAARKLQARLTLYRAESIDHWKTELIGGITKLTMVKLYEITSRAIDEFSGEDKIQYRVLRLRDGVYTQAVYEESGAVITEEFAPLANGRTIDHIPFHFVGAETNSQEVDDAVISGIVDLNTAHYQLSADHMLNLHMHAHGLLHIDTGETSATAWAELNPDGITVGANSGVTTQKGRVELVQLQPADAVQAKLAALEAQMLSVGAHLITERGDNETAEAARIDASTKASALLTATDNVSEAIEAALEDAALFMGGDGVAVEFSLNREFFPRSVSAQDVMSAIQLMDRGITAKTDLRGMIRGTAYMDSERTDEELDAEAEEAEPIMPVQSAQIPVATPAAV
jgi:hypothetical protein